MARNARLRVLGQSNRVPVGVRRGIDHVVHETRNNTGLTAADGLQLRRPGRAARRVPRARRVRSRTGDLKPEDITEKDVSGALYTADIPDPDLLIRTSGEMRISNFLLWQIAYTELLDHARALAGLRRERSLPGRGRVPEADAALRRSVTWARSTWPTERYATAWAGCR